MDSWESFFAEKARRRRARTIVRERALKGAVLALLVGSIAAAAYLQVNNLAG